VPPLIWGWLTYRVMAFDALALHASGDERRQIFKQYRMPLLAMGLVAGYLGAAPTLLWASGVMFVVFAPIFVVVAIWVYTLVFAFSSLWFAHFCLAALQTLRQGVIQAQSASDAGLEPGFKLNPALARAESAQDAIESVAKDAAIKSDAAQTDGSVTDVEPKARS